MNSAPNDKNELKFYIENDKFLGWSHYKNNPKDRSSLAKIAIEGEKLIIKIHPSEEVEMHKTDLVDVFDVIQHQIYGRMGGDDPPVSVPYASRFILQFNLDGKNIYCSSYNSDESYMRFVEKIRNRPFVDFKNQQAPRHYLIPIYAVIFPLLVRSSLTSSINEVMYSSSFLGGLLFFAILWLLFGVGPYFVVTRFIKNKIKTQALENDIKIGSPE